MSKKKSMVQPPPGRSEDLPIFADLHLVAKLLRTLRFMQNNRAYTVLEYHATWASVHFEGDLEPRVVTYRTE